MIIHTVYHTRNEFGYLHWLFILVCYYGSVGQRIANSIEATVDCLKMYQQERELLCMVPSLILQEVD